MTPIECYPNGLHDYGRAAVRAAQLCRNERLSPFAAWMKSTPEFLDSAKDPDKDCPMTAFLALCEAPFIKGIGPGKYIGDGNSVERDRILANTKWGPHAKTWACTAVVLLNNNTEGIADLVKTNIEKARKELKRLAIVTDNVDNHEMDVVIALWINKLIEQTADEAK